MNYELRQYWNGEECSKADRVRLSVEEDGCFVRLQVTAPFYKDPRPKAPVGSTPQLWEYEVVEWFVVGQGQPVPYLEVELGPYGHYLVLELKGIRTVVNTYETLRYATVIHGDWWEGTAFIPKKWLPNAPVTHNAFAIHGQGDRREFMTLYPTLGEKPDFHRLQTFRPLEWM